MNTAGLILFCICLCLLPASAAETGAVDKEVKSAVSSPGDQKKGAQNKPMPVMRMGTATPEEREKAKANLATLFADCKEQVLAVPLKALQVALVDGDTQALKKAFYQSGLSETQQWQAVSELQRELDEAGADLHVAMTSSNALVWYIGKGHYAVEVSAAAARPLVRPLQLPFGDIVILQAGEVLNMDPNDMARFFGRHAVLQITADRSQFPNLNKLDKQQH